MELQQAIALIHYHETFNKEKMIWADLGCGAGLFTNALAHFLKDGSKIFAVDKNIAGFKNLPGANEVVIEKIKADFINDELKIEKLDGILMANSLHYVKNKFAFIKKIEKHFKNNGCFLIVEYDMDKSNPWVPYPLSFEPLRRFFEETGYTSFNKINEAPSRFNRSKIYSVFIRK